MRSLSFALRDAHDLDTIVAKHTLEDTRGLLVQFFSAKSDPYFIEEIQHYFQKKFPLCIFIGTTTDGTIENEHVYDEDVSTINFSYFEKTNLKASLMRYGKDFQNSFECGYKMMKRLHDKEIKALITYSDGLLMNGEDYVRGCGEFATDVMVAGGMAADNGKMEQTFIFDKYEISDHGAVAVALYSSDLHVANHFSFDWLPIGKKMRVTKAVNNRVYELDGENIVDVYAKYLGKEVAAHLPQIGIELPLVFEENGVLIGRAVLGKHEDGSLTFAGNIKEGAYVQFGVGNVEMILKNSTYHVLKLLEALRYKMEAVFVFSCMARRRFLGVETKKELQVLRKIAPVCGFFTYGEFFHSKNKNLLLNETMTLLALSESDEEQPLEPLLKLYSPSDHTVDVSQAVALLANKVSNELSELNMALEERLAENAKYIYEQAYKDILTKLPNRLALIQDLHAEAGNVIFLINIDDFTAINDFYGHMVGDEVLKRLAVILKEHLPKEIKIYKLPSDEFALISPLHKSYSEILEFIKELTTMIEQKPFEIAGNEIHVSVTIAAAFIRHFRTGLRNVDMALKLAKQSNKKFIIYQEDMQLAKQYEDNINKVHLLKEALQKDAFVPFFQPICDVQTKEIKKYEALIRIVKENNEVIPPGEFLEASQKIKLYPLITKRMIEKSFAYCSTKGVDFSINLSYDNILDEELSRFLFKKMDEYAISERLTLEILETDALDYAKIEDFVNEIYARGAKIAIDDFGSGYANFKHIASLRCDYLKIDGSLIKDIDRDKNARSIVETIVIFAKKLGKKTIAEFVHSKEIFEIVKEIGIDYAQGYYLGKPVAEI